jgi:hypothetical protein
MIKVGAKNSVKTDLHQNKAKITPFRHKKTKPASTSQDVKPERRASLKSEKLGYTFPAPICHSLRAR